MTRLEKLEMAKELGYTCDFETGKVFGIKGKELKRKSNRNYLIFDLAGYKNQFIFHHHFIWYMYYNEVLEDKVIDHINRITTDNRIENLRLVTIQENSFNTKAKGICEIDGKYISRIMVNNKSIYLGYFDTEEEAHQAYLEAKEKYHIIS
jgi:hypothetical protein